MLRLDPLFPALLWLFKTREGKWCQPWLKRPTPLSLSKQRLKTILWAASVASEPSLEAAIIESDSKSCMDAMNGKLLEIPWRLNGFLNYFSPFKSANPNWVFNWVFRDANEAPHCLARWSLMNFLWGVYDFCNGPKWSSIFC